jgi:TonB family protein
MRINFFSVPGLRFRSSLQLLMLGVLPFAAFIAEARAQTPDQPSNLPGFTIVYEQTTAATENGVKRLRGIHVRYQRSDCWAKEVKTYFDETGTPRPSQIEQYLKRDHRSYSAEALRKNPSFDREEKVLGIETFVLRVNQGSAGDDYTEIFLAPELQGVQIKQVIVKKGTRDVIEPVSILRGEPDEKTLVRETSRGTQKKVDFTYGVLQGFAFKKVQPSYPAEANAAGVVGEVQVQILISETGTVIDAVPISGPPLLHAKALEAARQWVFRSKEISTETVKVQDTLTFNFAPQ